MEHSDMLIGHYFPFLIDIFSFKRLHKIIKGLGPSNKFKV